ncbi:MAG TPA: type II secretion system minor pseudopilin GspK [Gammaproteobacteria bacterium]|nr:type II secretion system minor pseudopilin GspK [Gammaproteobacteria bacterium]
MNRQINITKQQGTAIVVALFVTALVAAAAIAMIDRLSVDTRRTMLILNNQQANLYAEGSIAFAKDQLVNDLKFKQPTAVTDRTPITSPADKINGATVQSVIEDAQGKVNVNNLTDADYQLFFAQLIQQSAPGIPLSTAKNITQGVVDWITPGLHNTRFDQYYAKQNPPYRSAHHAMASVSELRLVQGMTPALYTALEPLVTALPLKTTININSAPLPVIMALSPAITPDIAKAFDQYRHESPLANLDGLKNFPAIQNSPIGKTALAVSSDFFLVKTHVTIGDQQTMLYTLMMRYLKKSQPAVIIVWQSKGTL